jgi:hypothetical protein
MIISSNSFAPYLRAHLSFSVSIGDSLSIPMPIGASERHAIHTIEGGTSLAAQGDAAFENINGQEMTEATNSHRRLTDDPAPRLLV